MFRRRGIAGLEIRDSKNVPLKRNCISCAKGVFGIKKHNFSLHPEIDAFVDIQRKKGPIFLLTDLVVDLFSCVSVLNGSLLGPLPCVPPIRQTIGIVVDPVVVARTKERMFARKTQMPLEVHSERPPRSRGK